MNAQENDQGVPRNNRRRCCSETDENIRIQEGLNRNTVSSVDYILGLRHLAEQERRRREAAEARIAAAAGRQ